jgi:hypothetical protein
VFAASFGYVEAVTVVYLRQLGNMPTGVDYAAIYRMRGLSLDSATITSEMRRMKVLPIEWTREIATLLLLAGAAIAGGRDRWERWGLFGFTFAVWDLSYYLYLAFWVNFPKSLWDTDIYFLVPIAWYGPVWFPVLVVMPIILGVSLRLLLRAYQLSSHETIQERDHVFDKPQNR